MQRLVLFGLIALGTAANGVAEEPADGFLAQVAAAIREHAPDATIETEDARLLARHDTVRE